MTSSSGVLIKDVEIDVLAKKYTDGLEIHSSKLNSMIEKDLTMQNWNATEKKFKSAFQQASLSGTDFDQVLSEFDNGNGLMSTSNFESVIYSLSPYVKFTPSEVDTIMHFFSYCIDRTIVSPGHVSIRDVMSHIGKEYTGKVHSRLLTFLHSDNEDPFDTFISEILSARGKTPNRDALTIDDVEEAFREFGVYKEFTRSQVEPIVQNILKLYPGITATGFLHELGFFRSGSKVAIDTEALLKLIIDRVKEKGVDVEATFRHFDSDGDGSLTKEELEEGFGILQIFDNIPDWRSQIPDLVNKFDSSRDGSVSMKEFLSHIGIKNYGPNIIQKMTKVFAVAMEKMTIEDIFNELDLDGDGFLTADELQRGLGALERSFSDVSVDDAAGVLAALGEGRADGRISSSHFSEFFGTRIKQVMAAKSRKRAEKLIQRFRNLMKLSIEKGLRPIDIFKHFAKGGKEDVTISSAEFTATVKSWPHFSSFSDEDIQGLVEVMDSDGSGDVSLQEFKQFLVRASSNVVNRNISSTITKVNEIFMSAGQHGSSHEAIFSYLDVHRNGRLSTDEFESRMKSFPHFDEKMSRELLQDLFAALDRNMDGEISLEAFRRLLRESPSYASNISTVGAGSREMFTRHLRRIAITDGGLTGLLAYLDRDGSGFISSESFYRLLSRENVHETLSVSECERLLQPITHDEAIDVTLLLRLIEDATFDPNHAHRAHSRIDDATVIQEDYEFSENPEIRATEKKLRSIGRTLASAGRNVEIMFQKVDPEGTGMIRRSDFIEILSKSGFYILEKGDVVVNEGTDDISKLQKQQVQRLKGKSNPSRLAERYVDHAKSNHEFQEHQESLALIDWYRQGQKRTMLDNVLSHSLSTSLSIYPQFAKTVFFEAEVRNPFAHEEFFIIDVSDPELRIVTDYSEWIHLRRHVKPATSIGLEPTDPDTFDLDGNGHVHFALLPNETMHLPFKFLSLTPTFASKMNIKARSESKNESKLSEHSTKSVPVRTVEVRIVSGTHGHVISKVLVSIHPRPFSVGRTLRYFEPEKTLMKKRIRLMGPKSTGETTPGYIHCVENGNESRAVVEYDNCSDSVDAVDIIIGYRCPTFPGAGSFYVLLYKDAHHAEIADIWFVVVQSRLKLDMHATVGSLTPMDLVVRGDVSNRRVQAFSSSQELTFNPSSVMKLVPRVYNRIVAKFSPTSAGTHRIHVNLVDADTSELVCSWVLIATAMSPTPTREYEVQISTRNSVHKKVTYQNPFDVDRRIMLSSSDRMIMKPRDTYVDLSPHGTAVIRLWFCKAGEEGKLPSAYLFLTDSSGQGEECLQFNIRTEH